MRTPLHATSGCLKITIYARSEELVRHTLYRPNSPILLWILTTRNLSLRAEQSFCIVSIALMCARLTLNIQLENATRERRFAIRTNSRLFVALGSDGCALSFSAIAHWIAEFSGV